MTFLCVTVKPFFPEFPSISSKSVMLSHYVIKIVTNSHQTAIKLACA